MLKRRYLNKLVTADLKEKMVFIGGPRQVCKTPLRRTLLKLASYDTLDILIYDFTHIDGSGFQVDNSRQTPSPFRYSETSARTLPRIGALLNIASLTMLLFPPLGGLGYISVQSDNLTMIILSTK